MGVLNRIFSGRDRKRLKEKENTKKTKRDEKKIKAQKKVEKQLTFTKVAIGFVLINSELQIWASYVLAFLGRDAIAEALSQQIVITIIGTMVGYFIKSLVENLSKYTTLFGQNLEFIEDDSLDNECQSDTLLNTDSVSEEICNDKYDELSTPINFNNSTMCDGITPIDTNENIMT